MRGGSKPGERRGGRQKGTPNRTTAEVKVLAQRWGPAVIETVAILAGVTPDRDGKLRPAASETAQLEACKILLDRAYGKSPRALEVGPADTFSEMLSNFLDVIDGRGHGIPPASKYYQGGLSS